jgi:spore germination cell wall hydrolase CwlJ-like protein
MSALSEDVLAAARTIWGEARGCGQWGMMGVASVILNRHKHPEKAWGSTIASVCLAPWQFSCWNEGDPNRPKMLAVTEADPAFASAVALAVRVQDGTLLDITDGADCYYARSMASPPAWAKGATRTHFDPCHNYVRTGAGSAPNVSVSAAEALNAAELQALGGDNGPHAD